MLDAAEIQGFYAWLDAQRFKTDAKTRAISEIEHLRSFVTKLGRDPVFEVGGSVPENLAAIELHHWRRRVAETEDRSLPPDAIDGFRDRRETEKARMAAEVAAAVAKRDAAAAERDAKARARREARRAATVPRQMKVAAPKKAMAPAAKASPGALPGQLDLF